MIYRQESVSYKEVPKNVTNSHNEWASTQQCLLIRTEPSRAPVWELSRKRFVVMRLQCGRNFAMEMVRGREDGDSPEHSYGWTMTYHANDTQPGPASTAPCMTSHRTAMHVDFTPSQYACRSGFLSRSRSGLSMYRLANTVCARAAPLCQEACEIDVMVRVDTAMLLTRADHGLDIACL
eukprot:1140869-Pelagomonas_calceolata.AAC.2